MNPEGNGFNVPGGGSDAGGGAVYRPQEISQDEVVEIAPAAPVEHLDTTYSINPEFISVDEEPTCIDERIEESKPDKIMSEGMAKNYSASTRAAFAYLLTESTFHTLAVTQRLSDLETIGELTTLDGTKYVKDAFGGFGPGSPEYDGSGRRLEIKIPSARAAVQWFEDTPKPKPTDIIKTVKESFVTNIATVDHPGVKSVQVEFAKSRTTSLVLGRMESHPNALTIPGAPRTVRGGLKVDTETAAKKLLTKHLNARLLAEYPDTAELDTENVLVIKAAEGINLYVDTAKVPGLSVGVNGFMDREYSHVPLRYGIKPTQKMLAAELTALQQHFPVIAEAYADFFRTQLPKTVIEIKPEGSEETGGDPVDPKRLEKLRQELLVTLPEDDFKYIGGLEAEIAKLRAAEVGFSHPEAFQEFGVKPPRGIMLMGPPGVGKTTIVNAFAKEIDAVVLKVKASVIKNAFQGETERNIRGVFQLADQLIAEGERVIIFYDEMEALAPDRNALSSSGIDNNVTTELLQGMNVDRPNCINIAATNAPDKIDKALTGNGSRFSEQITISLPEAEAREDIINKLFLKFTDRSTSKSQRALFGEDIQINSLVAVSDTLSGSDIENAIRKVLTAKAVMFASTGIKPQPATNGEIHQSIRQVIFDKENAKENYL